jgi:hypothetical protein
MARRIAAVGRVMVSLRRSMTDPVMAASYTTL